MNTLFDAPPMHDELIATFGPDQLRKVASVVAWAHVRCATLAREMWQDIGHARCGVIRWILIDSDLMRMKGKLPGVQIDEHHNNAGGGKHVELAAGNMRLLIVHDGDPSTYVPKTNYGHSLVQGNLFAAFDTTLQSLADNAVNRQYAVLFHSKSDKKGEVPDVLEIRFPDGANGYLEAPLNLYTRYPDLMNENWLQLQAIERDSVPAASIEKIKEEALPKLRPAAQVGT